MSWEYRGNNKYYYRKKRLGNRIVSEYVGRGEVAELIATSDVMNRNRLKAERIDAEEAIQSLNNNISYSDRLVKDFEIKVDIAVNSHLILNGYHQKKGEWRKARHDQKEKISR